MSLANENKIISYIMLEKLTNIKEKIAELFYLIQDKNKYKLDELIKKEGNFNHVVIVNELVDRLKTTKANIEKYKDIPELNTVILTTVIHNIRNIKTTMTIIINFYKKPFQSLKL